MTNPKILNQARFIQKCIILNEEGQILTLKRSLVKKSRTSNWDLPGGGYEEGEDLHNSVLREVQEEVGLTINSIQPIYLTNQVNIKTGLFTGETVFVACHLSKDWSGKVVLSDEHVEYRWVDPKELLDYDFGDDHEFFVNSIYAYLNVTSQIAHHNS